MFTFAKCVDTERHCGGGDPGEHDHYPGPGEGEEGYLPAQSSCFIHTLDTVLGVTCRQQREQHLVHLEDGEHEHVLHPDHHRHEAVDVAQVGAQAPVA